VSCEKKKKEKRRKENGIHIEATMFTAAATGNCAG